jgi:hypothetical protein
MGRRGGDAVSLAVGDVEIGETAQLPTVERRAFELRGTARRDDIALVAVRAR